MQGPHHATQVKLPSSAPFVVTVSASGITTSSSRVVTHTSTVANVDDDDDNDGESEKQEEGGGGGGGIVAVVSRRACSRPFNPASATSCRQRTTQDDVEEGSTTHNDANRRTLGAEKKGNVDPSRPSTCHRRILSLQDMQREGIPFPGLVRLMFGSRCVRGQCRTPSWWPHAPSFTLMGNSAS